MGRLTLPRGGFVGLVFEFEVVGGLLRLGLEPDIEGKAVGGSRFANGDDEGWTKGVGETT